jgi:hypothetical protein
VHKTPRQPKARVLSWAKDINEKGCFIVCHGVLDTSEQGLHALDNSSIRIGLRWATTCGY